MMLDLLQVNQATQHKSLWANWYYSTTCSHYWLPLVWHYTWSLHELHPSPKRWVWAPSWVRTAFLPPLLSVSPKQVQDRGQENTAPTGETHLPTCASSRGEWNCIGWDSIAHLGKLQWSLPWPQILKFGQRVECPILNRYLVSWASKLLDRSCKCLLVGIGTHIRFIHLQWAVEKC